MNTKLITISHLLGVVFILLGVTTLVGGIIIGAGNMPSAQLAAEVGSTMYTTAIMYIVGGVIGGLFCFAVSVGLYGLANIMMDMSKASDRENQILEQIAHSST